MKKLVSRQALKNEGHDVFPPYHKVMQAKLKCYPKDINITESSASIKVQDLLDHTATRLLESKSEDEISKIEGESLSLFTKWGCDVASGQS